MKEQLINFETAKLAKEKGFDWPTRFGFHNPKDLRDCFTGIGSYDCLNFNLNKRLYNLPTQSLLQKWLREKHNVHININTFYFTDNNIGYEVEDIIYKEDVLIIRDSQGSYEEALEKGLIEALKLIK